MIERLPNGRQLTIAPSLAVQVEVMFAVGRRHSDLFQGVRGKEYFAQVPFRLLYPTLRVSIEPRSGGSDEVVDEAVDEVENRVVGVDNCVGTTNSKARSVLYLICGLYNPCILKALDWPRVESTFANDLSFHKPHDMGLRSSLQVSSR